MANQESFPLLIFTGSVCVPDDALGEFPLAANARHLPAALPAIEQALGDRVAWHLFVHAESECEMSEQVRMSGRYMKPKKKRRKPKKKESGIHQLSLIDQ